MALWIESKASYQKMTEDGKLKKITEAYLVDALKVLESERCTFALTKPLAPVLVTEPDDPDFIYVVTPMRTAH